MTPIHLSLPQLQGFQLLLTQSGSSVDVHVLLCERFNKLNLYLPNLRCQNIISYLLCSKSKSNPSQQESQSWVYLELPRSFLLTIWNRLRSSLLRGNHLTQVFTEPSLPSGHPQHLVVSPPCVRSAQRSMATLWRSESCWCLTRASLFGNWRRQSRQAIFFQSASFSSSLSSLSTSSSSLSLSPL